MGVLPARGTALTPAERTALGAWLEHRSIRSAARSLGLSDYTLRDQLRNVRSRLGVRRLEDLDGFVLTDIPRG